MYLSRFLSIHALWVTVSSVMQPYPLVWGHYDVCKTQIYTEEGKVWDYMACQPESTDMTKYLKVKLDPPDITCGDPPETFCAMGNPYMCNNECDASTPELAHPPELMFDFEGRHPSTFWQSATWKEYPKPLQVNITLSWSKTIELTDNIVITFESGRPDQMILEKSLDYGRTWQPYQYYATDCLDAFHMDPKSVKDLSQHTVLEIICTEEYSTGYMTNSKIIHFEIKDRFAFFAGPWLRNMASLYGQLDTTKKLRDFFTVTDLRIRLLRPAVGEIFVDELHLARYFYAISDIKVHGRYPQYFQYWHECLRQRAPALPERRDVPQQRALPVPRRVHGHPVREAAVRRSGQLRLRLGPGRAPARLPRAAAAAGRSAGDSRPPGDLGGASSHQTGPAVGKHTQPQHLLLT
ncbi:netrin-G1 isoform X3 [Physeter macrocephalus]|uniref:Netrin-G1 isoform X3 n=1 Tax=Physeter macrocephalus TaxID=9755 RepID=A0A9W2WMJ6_PHYMC|nr:netrin-G1 isoform X3 [Physeter catodon]